MTATTRRIKRALDHTVDDAAAAAAHAARSAERAARHLAEQVGEGTDLARERLHDAADVTGMQVRRAGRHAAPRLVTAMTSTAMPHARGSVRSRPNR